MDITDKVILITGASSGIGKETGVHLSRKGAKTVLIARSENGLKRAREEIREITGEVPLSVQCDVADEKDVSRMADIVKAQYNRVDVLINNAGTGTYRVSEMITNEEMRRHFAVNFYGAYYCIKAVLPLMKPSGAGYILNVGSLFGKYVPFSDVSVYAASKFALAGFSDGLRRELKPYGIGVGHLMPGPVHTPFQDKKQEGERKTPEFLMIGPGKVAAAIEIMIRRGRKKAVVPKWMDLLFRAAAAFR